MSIPTRHVEAKISYQSGGNWKSQLAHPSHGSFVIVDLRNGSCERTVVGVGLALREDLPALNEHGLEKAVNDQ